MRYWALIISLATFPTGSAFPLAEARVEPQVSLVSGDYQWFRVGADEGRTYNFFLEYGLDDDTGLVLSYHRLRSGTDRVTLFGAYAKVELYESRERRSHSSIYAGFHARHDTAPGINDDLTGFQVGLLTAGSISSALRGLARLGADVYEDDTFFELELAAGLPLSSFGELQAGYRSIVSVRARDADTVDGFFLGLSVPLSRPQPLRW